MAPAADARPRARSHRVSARARVRTRARAPENPRRVEASAPRRPAATVGAGAPHHCVRPRPTGHFLRLPPARRRGQMTRPGPAPGIELLLLSLATHAARCGAAGRAAWIISCARVFILLRRGRARAGGGATPSPAARSWRQFFAPSWPAARKHTHKCQLSRPGRAHTPRSSSPGLASRRQASSSSLAHQREQVAGGQPIELDT